MEIVNTKRILIAEDERMIGDMLHFELSSHGPQVTVARDGEEAIAQIESSPPDLLLLDLLMPKKSGYDVLEYLRSHNASFPVVVLSNLSDQKEQQKCIELGAKEFLVKSRVDPDQLWGKLQKHLV